MPGPIRGVFFYLYLILDIFSSKIVAWEVHARGSAEHAADLACKAVWAEGCLTRPLVLHADNGSPMKGATMKATLERLGVIASYSRPRVSDDNPFSEALFRTCSTGRTGRHRVSPARRTRNAGSPVSWPGTSTNPAIARSGSSRPAPDTQARTALSSLVAPTSIPTLAPPTPPGGHVRSETGRPSATSASTPSATPATAKSETLPDRHRTTPLTNTVHQLCGIRREGPHSGATPARSLGMQEAEQERWLT